MRLEVVLGQDLRGHALRVGGRVRRAPRGTELKGGAARPQVTRSARARSYYLSIQVSNLQVQKNMLHLAVEVWL